MVELQKYFELNNHIFGKYKRLLWNTSLRIVALHNFYNYISMRVISV